MKMINRSLFFIIFTFLFMGCGQSDDRGTFAFMKVTDDMFKDVIGIVQSVDENIVTDIENIAEQIESENSEPSLTVEELAEINEKATVSDGDYTVTLGTLFDDFEYDEEVIVSEALVTNYQWTSVIDGKYYDWYGYGYKDINIYSTSFNPIIGDMSGRNMYILQIELMTDRYYTSDGITVGFTSEELKKIYGDKLEWIDKDGELDNDEWMCIYVNGRVETRFYFEDGLVEMISLNFN